ncbi:MAG TPA: MotA/TolQ/ExbB proton channel family protein [Planctomycetaceae bacterium]|nr:MotA/TolQ/ExbB proton channel family protein [Planctomycetaceae bacterium]
MPLLEKRSRAPMWLWLVLLAAIATIMMRPVTVSAQADGEAPAAAENAPAAEGEAGEDAGGHGGGQQSTLWWIIHTSGWIGAVLLIISIYFVALVVQLFLELREHVICPPELTEQCEQLLQKRDYNGIYKLCKENTSELGQLIAAGMAALSGGLADARESIDRLGETLTVEMEKRISMLAVIGSLGPMIGLLGTLKGMIASFGTIAMSGAQMKASEVAGGISEALLITFEGVALSVPAIYFFAVFKNRVSTFSLMAINRADDFIRRVHATASSKAPPPPAAQAAAPTA